MHMAISSDVIRGYNDTMILYLLLDQPSYGYEISRQIKTLSQLDILYFKHRIKIKDEKQITKLFSNDQNQRTSA